ncbi:MAG: hypothetical protein U9R51_02020 [Actinomycetota bacterium]|nr:hypothetical protein [Actinomycetota bacterium]
MVPRTSLDEVHSDPGGNGSSRRTPAWLICALVALPTLLVLLVVLGIFNFSADGLGSLFQFPDLLRANTPTGGDTGAHVLLPRILEDSVLPSGRLLGWSNAWFAGFPVLYLYAPLPLLTIVVLDVFIPYGVAFKVVVAAGLVALPGCTFFLVRSLGFDRIVASVAATTGGMFIFMDSYGSHGGNIMSTLVGEFSYSWSLAFSVCYLGLISRAIREQRRIDPWPGVLLALVAVSHIVSVVVVVAVSAVFLLFRRTALRVIVTSWLLGFGLAAFWALPFAHLVLQGMLTDPGWVPLEYVIGPNSPLPGEIVPAMVAGSVAALWLLIRRHRIGLLIGLTVLPLAGYFLLPSFGVSSLWSVRLLPYWFYGVFVLAGIGVGLSVNAIGRRILTRRDAAAIGAAVATTAMMLVTVVTAVEIPSWVHWSFSGYEAKEPYPEYRALMDSVDALPPGRVIWEYNGEIRKYGTDIALTLLPYWSRAHPSMEGLYRDSSLTAPFSFLNRNEVSLDPREVIPGLNYHAMDFGRATEHLALYGVKYYVSYTEEAERAARRFGLEPVAVSRPWVVFELPQSELVEVAASEPAVWTGGGDFSVAALDWYDDIDHLDRWLTAAGPEAWVRVETVDERLAVPPLGYEAGSQAVANVQLEDHRISFDTTAIGVPHLVKVSYFPNWRVDGADGPYRAAPSLMIVVPTSESVVLTFERSWSEKIGLVLTAVSIVGVGVWVYRRRRMGTVERRSPDTESAVDG